MNPSSTDHPLRRPVAFLWNRSPAPEPAVVSLAIYLLLLSAGEYEPLDFLAAVEVDDGPEQLSLLVGASGVDAKRAPDARVALRLVDVTVQRQARLSLLYCLPHRLRADRYDRAPAMLGAHVLVYLGGVVEPGFERRAVEVVDRLLCRGRHLRGHLPQPLGEVLLVLLAVGVPGRALRPPGRDHLEVAELDDLALGEPYALGGGDDLIDLELVIVAWADEALDVGAFELLVGHLHPALDRPQHLLVEELIAQILIRLELAHLVRVGAERVVAAPLDRVLELLYLVFALEFPPVLE